MSFRDAAASAEVLARTSLLASFDDLRDTTEGLIVLMNSFGSTAEEAAKGLEVINVVAKRFAVESGDIVEGLKKAGGAFYAAGGTMEEFTALMTTVRSQLVNLLKRLESPLKPFLVASKDPKLLSTLSSSV